MGRSGVVCVLAVVAAACAAGDPFVPVGTCEDGRKNGGEAGVDCGGGVCGPCPDGESCASSVDCASGWCDGGRCRKPSCTDGVTNGGESDVDCGGPCVGCGDGKKCKVESDCQSRQCTAGVCAPPP
jgi:hypothetical protein